MYPPELRKPLFRASVLGLLCVALALPAGAQGQPGGSSSAQPAPGGGGYGAACRKPLPPEDPTTARDFNCYYWGHYTWNLGGGVGPVEGRIYWPSLCGDGTTEPPPGQWPLVLLMHGDGHSYTDYHYLMRHLAFNGFICATIDNHGTNAERTDQALTYLSFIFNNWSLQGFVENNVALMGHSRGGEAVLTLARTIDDFGLPYNVGSILSLAPTDNHEGGGSHESLDGDQSHHYLVMYGTHDEDVYGYCVNGGLPDCGAPLLEPRGTGFTLYDRAGSEYETEPFPLSSEVVTKSMLFIQGANHNSWREIPCGFPGVGQLDCETHKNLLRGYANAWLRFSLRDQPIYRYYFTGDFVLQSEPAVYIRHQYQEGWGRRVVDNFQGGGFSQNTIGGSVTAESTINVIKEGTTYDYEPTIPHDTDALIFTWAPPGLAPWIRWVIPDGSSLFGGRYRDVTRYDYLSFRAGQVRGSAFNVPGEDKDFYVQLLDSGGGQSNWIRVSDHARLSYPTDAGVVYFNQPIVTSTSPMTTVRIPLCDVEGIDKENVSSIRFWFTVPGSTSGELVLDNLEFTD